MTFTIYLENNQELFRYLFEEASLGIGVENIDGTLLLANPALCSMLGYQQGEMCGMSCSQFAHPEDSQDDWALFQKLRAGLIDRYSLEKRYVRRDGAQIFGRLHVSLLKGSEGEAPLVFALVEDVTDSKRTEEALYEREEKLELYKEAIENTEELITVVDREYRYVMANRAFLNHRKTTREQIVGKLLSEVLDKGIFETVSKEKLDRCFNGEVVRYESRRGTKDLLISHLRDLPPPPEYVSVQ
jgi:PAS domain S-box-containing protein